MEKSSITDEVRVMAKDQKGKEADLVIGNYSFGKTLGKGTFGKVKEAIHLPTGEKVAVKIVDKRTLEDQDDQTRIKRQVEIMKKARHPNIIYLYEIIETADFIYLVVQFAQQGELFRVMTTEVRLKQRAAGRIFYQILNAVQYLHRLDIAHRDLKPENILLDNDFNVKLIDFGLSNYQHSGKLLSTACGSPCYAPPEMVAGKAYNGIIGDIWSLGIIFYGMVCGSLPFQEKTTKQLYKKVIEGFYVLPSDISVDAIQVIQKMLVTDPNKRITISEIRKLKFFKQIRNIEPQIIGLIVGFHAMPIDNEIIQRMKEYTAFSKRQAQNQLKQNEHNSLTTLYYLMQKKTLREGNKTISDLQAYLQSSEKYRNEYGKDSLRKYRKLLFEAQITKNGSAKSKDRDPLINRKSQERTFFSNEKLRRKVTVDDQKISLSVRRRPPTTVKTERSVEDKITPIKSQIKNKYVEVSPPQKRQRSTAKKMAMDLWKAYFKNPLQEVGKQRLKKKQEIKVKGLDQNVKKLKQGFLRLPNMLRKYKNKRQLG